jgi:probable F420-dependent oxidoreductase
MHHSSSNGNVSLGLVLPNFDEPARLWEAARTAEQQGFHSVWVTDATLTGYPWMETLSVLGGLAATTSTVQIGTSVYILARRNPVLMAHALATLDHLSDGRMNFGVGVGEKGFRPQEYAIAGVSMDQRGAITDEYLGLLRRLWTESGVTHQGKYFQCTEITVEPKPNRPETIPYWIGGKSAGSLRRAQTHGDAWLPGIIGVEEFRTLWNQLSTSLAASGRDPDGMTRGIHAFGAISRNREEARQTLAPGIEAVFGAPFAVFEPMCIVGTPDDWLDQIGQFAGAGAQHLNVMLFTRDLVADVQLIGEEVLSRLGQPRPAQPPTYPDPDSLDPAAMVIDLDSALADREAVAQRPSA